jgi:hypothetical protein
LANIEKRWEAMPPQEQADLWMALRDRMKVNWTELTVQEKKAGTFANPLPGPFTTPATLDKHVKSSGWVLTWRIGLEGASNGCWDKSRHE